MIHYRGSWPAYGAALWALIFAVLHVVWAAGWHIGLRAEVARRAFEQPWFVAYDLVVAGVCVLAVVVALAMVRPWGRRLPRSVVGPLAWGGTGLLILRAGASLIQLAYFVVTGAFVADAMQLWEVWFSIGAILFGLSTWKFWTSKRGGAFAAEPAVPPDDGRHERNHRR